MNVDANARVQGLRILIQSFPEEAVKGQPVPEATLQWLARLRALAKAGNEGRYAVEVDMFSTEQYLVSGWSFTRLKLLTIAHSLLASAELEATPGAFLGFIGSGSPFDALSAVGNVLKLTKSEALVIDPYMDEVVLRDFAPFLPDNVKLRLLADSSSVKATLKPAAQRWILQYPGRKLEVRLAPSRELHDRLILMDMSKVWALSQSFKDLAARSPASIIEADPQTAALKVAAYEDIWTRSSPI